MSLKTKTQTFAVIGDPIGHSKSPDIFNAAFKALGINANYRALQIKESALENLFQKIHLNEISGVNVTIPLKQKVFKFCDEISDFAKKVGAINTIIKRKNKLFGDNTDGPGYLLALEEIQPFTLDTAHIVVLGAGGASRGICHALCGQKIASLTMAGRNLKSVQDLSHDMKKNYKSKKITTVNWSAMSSHLTSCDLLINATPLGMDGNKWPDLSFLKMLKKTAVVSDIVYNPLETELILAAKKQGLQTHPGHLMFLHQAMLAFEIFTQKKAPRNVMESALLKSL